MRALLLAALALAVLAPAALADDFDKVFKDYSGDGRIDPCKHTAAQLQRARKDVPPDIEQYAPDFPDALDQAIEARARGRCDKTKKAAAPAPTQQDTLGTSTPEISKTTTGSTGPTGPTTTASSGAGEPPAPAADHAVPGVPKDNAIARAANANGSGGDSDVPAPLIALAALAAALALGAAAVGLARWRGWEPPWALRARHALGEAGWRAGNTWSEFADWVRTGR